MKDNNQDNDFIKNFRNIWADNGDAISYHYTGTGSTHTEYFLFNSASQEMENEGGLVTSNINTRQLPDFTIKTFGTFTR